MFNIYFVSIENLKVGHCSNRLYPRSLTGKVLSRRNCRKSYVIFLTRQNLVGNIVACPTTRPGRAGPALFFKPLRLNVLLCHNIT